MPDVKPEILVWARETAGFSLDQAASKLGFRDSKGATATERLAAIEAGAATLTRPLLLKMAKAYRRPLIAFYLGAPPHKGDRGEDFRSLRDRDVSFAPLIDALVRDIKARQSMIRAIKVTEDEAAPIPFVNSMQIESGVGAVVASMR